MNLKEMVTELQRLKACISNGNVCSVGVWVAMYVAMYKGTICEAYLKNGVEWGALQESLGRLERQYANSTQFEQVSRRRSNIVFVIMVANELAVSRGVCANYAEILSQRCRREVKRKLEVIGVCSLYLDRYRAAVGRIVPLIQLLFVELEKGRYCEKQSQEEGEPLFFRIATQQLLQEAVGVLREIEHLEQQFMWQCEEIQKIHADFMELMEQLGLQREAKEARGQSDEQMMSDNQVASEVARTFPSGTVEKTGQFMCALGSGQADEEQVAGCMHTLSVTPATGLRRSDLP